MKFNVDMKRAYEEIEKDILKIKKELVSSIREALKEHGFGIDEIVSGNRVNICVFDDWNHIMVLDKWEDRDNWHHVDYCSVDVLLEAYKTVLHAWKY